MADQLTKLLTKAEYKYVDYTRKDISNAVECFKFLTPTYGRYTYPSGVTREIVWLDGNMQVTRLGSNFDISIGLLIHNKHPIEVPRRFIKPPQNSTKPAWRANKSRIYLPDLRGWEEDKSNLISIIGRMLNIIDRMYPKQIMAQAASTIPPQLSTPGRPNLSGFIKLRKNNMKTLISSVEGKLKRFERLKELHKELEALMRTWDDLSNDKIQINDLEATIADADEKYEEIGLQLLVWEYSILESYSKKTVSTNLKPKWPAWRAFFIILHDLKKTIKTGKV